MIHSATAASVEMVFHSAGLVATVLVAVLGDLVQAGRCQAARFCWQLALAAQVVVLGTWYPAGLGWHL